jgi:hypothetical protein
MPHITITFNKAEDCYPNETLLDEHAKFLEEDDM